MEYRQQAGHLPMRRPDFEGFGGRAWKCPVDENVSGWLLELPGAHPIWDNFLLTISYYGDGSIYGLCLNTVHPDADRESFLRQPAAIQRVLGKEVDVLIRPHLFRTALLTPSVEAALRRAEVAVGLMVRGDLKPFGDKSDWETLYG